jgi:hypothetical protein
MRQALQGQQPVRALQRPPVPLAQVLLLARG